MTERTDSGKIRYGGELKGSKAVTLSLKAAERAHAVHTVTRITSLQPTLMKTHLTGIHRTMEKKN